METNDDRLSYLAQCRRGVVEIVAGRVGEERILKDLWLSRFGFGHQMEAEEAQAVTLKDIRQLRIPFYFIRGCGQYMRGIREGALRAFPLMEFQVGNAPAETFEMIFERWRGLANELNIEVIGQRMIAPKRHMIWQRLSDFGRPWWPYFQAELPGGEWCGIMNYVRSVSRSDWRALGSPFEDEVIYQKGYPGIVTSGVELATAWEEDEDGCPFDGFPSPVPPRENWDPA